MKKIILKFKDLIETIVIFDGISAGQITVTLTNIDDIFCVLREKGINELKVDWRIMLMISRFVVANLPSMKEKEKLDIDALNLLRKGEIDYFMGIKLILDENQSNREITKAE